MIIGGGISGISASLSAAREGSTVCLVESNNELGGSIGENSQMPLDYASSCNDPFFRESGIFEEITTNLRLGNKEGTFTGQARALLNLVKTEPNITTMLGCQCLEVTLILLRIALIHAQSLIILIPVNFCTEPSILSIVRMVENSPSWQMSLEKAATQQTQSQEDRSEFVQI